MTVMYRIGNLWKEEILPFSTSALKSTLENLFRFIDEVKIVYLGGRNKLLVLEVANYLQQRVRKECRYVYVYSRSNKSAAGNLREIILLGDYGVFTADIDNSFAEKQYRWQLIKEFVEARKEIIKLMHQSSSVLSVLMPEITQKITGRYAVKELIKKLNEEDLESLSLEKIKEILVLDVRELFSDFLPDEIRRSLLKILKKTLKRLKRIEEKKKKISKRIERIAKHHPIFEKFKTTSAAALSLLLDKKDFEGKPKKEIKRRLRRLTGINIIQLKGKKPKISRRNPVIRTLIFDLTKPKLGKELITKREKERGRKMTRIKQIEIIIDYIATLLK